MNSIYNPSPVAIVNVVCIYLILTLNTILAVEPNGGVENPDSLKSSTSFLPFILYDSDVGFGIGGKGLIKNRYRASESLDLLLFATNKGMQWYVFNFSIPDAELRQGKKFDFAIDVLLKFKKELKSNYFGTGNLTADNEYQFPKESLDFSIIIGHAFTPRLIWESGVRYSHYSVYDWDPQWGTIASNTSGVGTTESFTISQALSHDTRNSQIDPSRGHRLFIQEEICLGLLGLKSDEWRFHKIRFEGSQYFPVSQSHVAAIRLWTQTV